MHISYEEFLSLVVKLFRPIIEELVMSTLADFEAKFESYKNLSNQRYTTLTQAYEVLKAQITQAQSGQSADMDKAIADVDQAIAELQPTATTDSTPAATTDSTPVGSSAS